MKMAGIVAACAGLIGLGALVLQAKPPQEAEGEVNVLDHEMNLIDGEAVSLTEYEGKVVLIVNTASKCGFTRQYEGLQALYESKKDDGLVVLGFPANNFLGQEPGSNKQIAQFCSSEFGVTFPMFEKISVKGSDAHPLFKQLSGAVGAPSWNFNKYLVDREGNVVARYDSSTSPQDADLVKRIDGLLGS
jgi:glutathione peroxidase